MAANFTLKLGSLDLSAYTRVNPDDALDVYGGGGWIEPGFVDTPFTDGQALASTDVRNRETVWPLYLKAASKDLLHALVAQVQREINRIKAEQITLEWRDANATASTFYDVVFARFEPDFNFRRGEHGYLGGKLHVWTTGYGHTGTYRISATTPVTASAAAAQIPVASIGGDSPALLDVLVRSGTAVSPIYGAQILAAPLSHPSQVAIWLAASLSVPSIAAGPGATLLGASGAQGSQVLAMFAATGAPTGMPSVALTTRLTLPIASAYAGQRWRAIALARTHMLNGMILQGVGPDGAAGPTQIASWWNGGFALTDLGAFSVPTIVPTQVTLGVRAGVPPATGMSPHNAIASQAFGVHLNAVILLPEGAAHGAADLRLVPLVRDRFLATQAALITGVTDELGNAYATANGLNLKADPLGGAWSASSMNSPVSGLTAVTQLTTDAQDMVMRTIARFPSGVCAAATDAILTVAGAGDAFNIAVWGQAYMASGRMFLYNGVSGASVGLASTAGRKWLFEVGQVGNSQWVSARSLDGLSQFASVGNGATVVPVPPIRQIIWGAQNPTTVASSIGALALERIEAFKVASQAANPRQLYHLGQRYLADASDNPVRDTTGRALGAPPVISPSAPAVAVVEQVPGEAANDLLDVTVRVRERFTLAR